MITSVKKWKNKEELNAILKDRPDLVDVSGDVMDASGYIRNGFTGRVVDIPYGITVIAKYKGNTYAFKKGMNGQYRVY